MYLRCCVKSELELVIGKLKQLLNYVSYKMLSELAHNNKGGRGSKESVKRNLLKGEVCLNTCGFHELVLRRQFFHLTKSQLIYNNYSWLGYI